MCSLFLYQLSMFYLLSPYASCFALLFRVCHVCPCLAQSLQILLFFFQPSLMPFLVLLPSLSHFPFSLDLFLFLFFPPLCLCPISYSNTTPEYLSYSILYSEPTSLPHYFYILSFFYEDKLVHVFLDIRHGVLVTPTHFPGLWPLGAS